MIGGSHAAAFLVALQEAREANRVEALALLVEAGATRCPAAAHRGAGPDATCGAVLALDRAARLAVPVYPIRPLAGCARP